MKRIIIIQLGLLFLAFNLNGQSIMPQWVSNFSSPALNVSVLGLVVDSAGSSYVMEYQEDTTAGPQNLSGNYIFKYNTYGQLQWVDTIRSWTYPYNGRIAMGKDGSVFVAVTDSGAFMFARIAPTGTILWRRYFSFPAPVGALMDFAIDDSINLYAISNSIDQEKAYILKSDSSGNLKWNAIYDYLPQKYDVGRSICIDNGGNVYAAVSSADTTFYPVYSIVKYSPSGQFLWQRQFNSFLGQVPMIIRAYGSSVIVTGLCYNIMGRGDYLTQKYDSSGAMIWSAVFNADSVLASVYDRPDTPKGMVITRTGNAAIVGECADNGMPLWFDIMYDAQGHLKWARKDFSTSFATRVAENHAGHLVFVGDATDTLSYSFGMGVTKYDTLGTRLWKANYISTPLDGYRSICLGLDYADNIYCSSAKHDLNGIIVTTLKYDHSVAVEEENSESPGVIYFPNPASNTISFQLPGSLGDCFIHVYDQLGNEVEVVRSESFQTTLPVNQYSNGIYLFRIERDGLCIYQNKFTVLR